MYLTHPTQIALLALDVPPAAESLRACGRKQNASPPAGACCIRSGGTQVTTLACVDQATLVTGVGQSGEARYRSSRQRRAQYWGVAVCGRPVSDICEPDKGPFRHSTKRRSVAICDEWGSGRSGLRNLDQLAGDAFAGRVHGRAARWPPLLTIPRAQDPTAPARRGRRLAQ